MWWNTNVMSENNKYLWILQYIEILMQKLEYVFLIMKYDQIRVLIFECSYFIIKCNRIPKSISDFMSILDFMYFILKCNNTYWCCCTSWFVQFEQMCAKDLIQLRGGIEWAPMHYFISNVKYFCKSPSSQDIPIWLVIKLINFGGITKFSLGRGLKELPHTK